jgi:hypothetical protein
MNKALYKDPLVVAVSLTLLALLILPHRIPFLINNKLTVFRYRFVTTADMSFFHWPTFVAEMALIWGGFFLYNHITKLKENEYSRDKLAKVAQELSKDLLNQIEENKWKPK